MKILWTYLKPYRWLILLSLALAGAAQLLSLVDPIIFGKIIDGYAFQQNVRPESELVSGVLRLLAIAVGVAALSRFARVMQDYVVNLVVQKFGVQIFNDGIRQTLRMSYEEFMNQRSGETLSILQSVRTDTERFISAFINILFSSMVGVGFLIWYALTKTLGPRARVPHRHPRPRRPDGAAERQDQDAPAQHQARDEPDVGGDHRIAAQHDWTFDASVRVSVLLQPVFLDPGHTPVTAQDCH